MKKYVVAFVGDMQTSLSNFTLPELIPLEEINEAIKVYVGNNPDIKLWTVIIREVD